MLHYLDPFYVNIFYWLSLWEVPVKLCKGGWQTQPLTDSKSTLIQVTGTTRHQPITWINFDQMLEVHVTSPQDILWIFKSMTPCAGGRFKNTYELLNLRALKISKLHKNHIFQCMGKIFCVEFQRVPLKFHTKYLTHTLKDVDFIHIWKFKSSLI